MIRFSCPQCKLVLQATDQKVGSITACPKCSKRMKVPEGPSKAPLEEARSTQTFSVEQAIASDWLYLKEGKKLGPVSLDDLKQLLAAGQLLAADLVLKTGMQKWVPLNSVLDLVPAKPSVATGPKEWFYVRDKRKSGPVSIQELKLLAGEGKLSAGDMVLKDGTQKWLTAGALAEVFPAGMKDPVSPDLAKPAGRQGPTIPEIKARAPTPPPGVPQPRPIPAEARPNPLSPVVQPRPTMPGSPSPLAPPAEPRPSSAKLKHPVPAVTPPTPLPPMPDLDDYIDEPPLPSDEAGPYTPREEPTKVAAKPARKKLKRKQAKRGGASGTFRALVAAWLGVVVFRTVALIQFEPQLSLWIWPIEWLAGLAIAWLSYRRRVRLGVLVGLLGPLVVLSAMAAFTGMGLSKEEGLEYLRWVMVPYGLLALILGFLVLRAARRGRRLLPPLKSIRTHKKRASPSTMSMQPLDEEDSSASEVAALE